MVRRYKPEGRRKFRLLYWVSVAVVIGVWAWCFKLYFQRYDYLHPDVTWAVPGIDEETVTAEGALLWQETVLRAPFDGTVTYPQGRNPVRVGRGAVVAIVKSGSRSAEIKASQQGYFVAGVDGAEEFWKYSELWPGTDLIPVRSKLSLIENGSQVQSGQAVGKILAQPQELRFVGYANISGNMSRQLKNNRLKVKMDEEDTVSSAEVRVYNELPNGKVKLYLTLPWFQPSLLFSRNYRLIIEAGSVKGAVVPESAMLRKNGDLGVYTIRGSRVIFNPVAGKHLDGGRYLIIKGLSVGDVVVEDASKAREGRIQLW